jgi:uncharacterized protein
MRAAGFVVFFAVVLTINFALHGYLWWRVVRAPAWPAPWTRGGTAVLLALALILAAALPLARVAPRGIAVPLSWVAFVWLGLLFLLFVLLLLTEPLRPALRLLPAAQGAHWVSRMVAIGALACGTLLGGAAILSARMPTSVHSVPVQLAHWPSELTGYTIVQVSDIHIGETVGKGFVERMERQVNELSPDMIVITGDLVDGRVKELAPLAAPLAELRARDGVWFVTGNHEYYSGAPAWVAHLSSLGIRVLRNERVPIGGEKGFDLAGTDDYTARSHAQGHGEDIPRALAGRDPERPVILLAHQPRSFPAAVAAGVDLQLSGHTHGGQIWPFHYLTRSVQPYLSGLHGEGSSQIYVSRGTGYWGPPMRFLAPAEITRVVLSP